MNKEGDVVLVHMEGKPAFFARIEGIAADVKPEWFQVKLLVLQAPLLLLTWILREPYINGDEFTMGGRPVRLEKVVAPEQPGDVEEESASQALVPEKENRKAGHAPHGEGAKVVSIFERKKKGQPS